MAADSKLLLIGDAITADIIVKAHARILLTGFEEDVSGLNPPSVNVFREFRYTTDYIFWTDFLEMTPENLFLNTIKVEDEATIQIRYTRTGTDESTLIEFNSITLLGEADVIQYETPTIDESIFSSVYPTKETQKLAVNLFKKLYFRGIVPKYIIRGEDRDYVEDEDYISLAKTIGHYFALFIQYFKRFDNFYNDEELMREYVRQYGVYFDESNVTLQDLQYLTQHIYDEIRKRGTISIFNRKGDALPDGDIAQIDGEFIRLLRSKTYNELSFEMLQVDETGWCIGKSSPLWMGTNDSVALNKTKEKTEEFQNLDNFKTTTSGNGVISLVEYNDKMCAKIEVISVNDIAAFGNYENSSEVDIKDVFVVDANIDYEVSFNMLLNTDIKVTFGVEGFDFNGRRLYDDFNSIQSMSLSNMFGVINKSQVPDTWLTWRGIIHAYSTVQLINNKTNLGFGSDLVFNNRFVHYILPKIVFENNGTDGVGDAYIYNYKIRPSVRGTNIMPLRNGYENSHSLGFVECPPILYMYARNNNNSQSLQDITDIIDKYLLPFNVSMIPQLLS
jgi:hypothetical protein